MNIFLEIHRLTLEKLVEKKVDFMLVGGYAVNYHGYNRVTGDMDLWVRPDNENKHLLLAALRDLDFDEEGMAEVKSWDFTTPKLFKIWPEPFQTEFMTHISGVTYSVAKGTAIHADFDGLIIPVIHIQNLIINKKATNRLKDQADVEYLQKIQDLKSKL